MIFTRRHCHARSRYPMRNFGRNQLLDGSMSLSLLYPASTKKFARYHRVEPPPSFRLASPSPGIAHHLSGGSPRTPAQHLGHCCAPEPADAASSLDREDSRLAHFHCALSDFTIGRLARELRSLVRVPRRVEESVDQGAGTTRCCMVVLPDSAPPTHRIGASLPANEGGSSRHPL
jgi:hypothetical protein